MNMPPYYSKYGISAMFRGSVFLAAGVKVGRFNAAAFGGTCSRTM